MPTRVEVVGKPRLLATLRELARAVSDSTQPNQASGAKLVADARSNAPRRSGRLAASLTVSAGPDELTIAGGVPYAGVQEWGWRVRGIEGRHFLGRAFEANRDGIVDEEMTYIEGAVRRVKGA